MDTDKIRQIIDSKNEQRERQMVRSAEDIIENILCQQQRITEANAKIVELRKELTALELTAIDTATVLGGN